MKSFEERLNRLEELSEKLKTGNVPLAESVTVFEEGITLARSLEKELAEIERKVEILVNTPDLEAEVPLKRGETRPEESDTSQPDSSLKASDRERAADPGASDRIGPGPALELFPELDKDEQ